MNMKGGDIFNISFNVFSDLHKNQGVYHMCTVKCILYSSTGSPFLFPH